MPAGFDLEVVTDARALTTELRLRDPAGNQLAWNQVRLRDHPASRWEGLFDLRRYVRRYAGNDVLGPEIMGRLGQGIQQRTVRVRLPKAGADHLAAAFARVPWEIARPGEDGPTLGERNVLVRVLAGELEAARYYNIMAEGAFGPFAKLNEFPR
jgi:hypothetical protein